MWLPDVSDLFNLPSFNGFTHHHVAAKEEHEPFMRFSE